MTDITELAPAMKAAAEPISSGYSRNWIVSHDDETCWVGANDDDGNLTPFIEVSIADWSGNKADNEKLARFIALCRPANVIALVEALERAQRANGYLREQSAEWERKAISNFEDCAEISARIEGLESQRKLAFTASNRWADKFREAEQRIAELESRTFTVNLPPKIERDDADGWFTYKGGRVGGGAAEWYNKALDDVGAASASTVTVKLPDDEDGQAYGFGKWANGKLPATTGTMTISYCEDAWRAAFEVFSNAAGIKWESE